MKICSACKGIFEFFLNKPIQVFPQGPITVDRSPWLCDTCKDNPDNE